MRKVTDRTEPGRELAGGIRYRLIGSVDGGRRFDGLSRSRRIPIRRDVRLRGTRTNVLIATACDRNGNCGIRRLGRFRP
jgi:hypothetical protein